MSRTREDQREDEEESGQPGDRRPPGHGHAHGTRCELWRPSWVDGYRAVLVGREMSWFLRWAL
jgi:hypothetical protein